MTKLYCAFGETNRSPGRSVAPEAIADAGGAGGAGRSGEGVSTDSGPGGNGTGSGVGVGVAVEGGTGVVPAGAWSAVTVIALLVATIRRPDMTRTRIVALEPPAGYDTEYRPLRPSRAESARFTQT